MMRTNGSAGMRGGAMWQRLQRDLTVLMTHNTVQPELAADSFGRLHFGLLPHGVEEGVGPGAAAGALRRPAGVRFCRGRLAELRGQCIEGGGRGCRRRAAGASDSATPLRFVSRLRDNRQQHRQAVRARREPGRARRHDRPQPITIVCSSVSCSTA